MLGGDPDADEEKRQMAVDACIKPFLDRAREEGVPVWTEASTEEKKTAYERLGFRMAEEALIGKGRVDGSGVPKEGGEGVRCWAMLFDEHLR